ncbi:MAG: Rrf2 family transcriptional regulator [Bacteroidetes bacterium]|nr:MAG: Rrf2 family transcriptional regulator [Bacteroidota bacterium]
MFSKACEYGIRAAIFIALQSLQGRRVSLKSIAAEINSPEAFTAKILQQLVRSGLVESLRGPGGGFSIPGDRIAQIRLSEIVYAIDGDKLYEGCGLGLEQCDARYPCPLHDKFVEVRRDLRNMLEQTSLDELLTGLEVGLTYLRR